MISGLGYKKTKQKNTVKTEEKQNEIDMASQICEVNENMSQCIVNIQQRPAMFYTDAYTIPQCMVSSGLYSETERFTVSNERSGFSITNYKTTIILLFFATSIEMIHYFIAGRPMFTTKNILIAMVDLVSICTISYAVQTPI